MDNLADRGCTLSHHQRVVAAAFTTLLELIGITVVVMNRWDNKDGENASGYGHAVPTDPGGSLTQDDVKLLERPGILGVGGFAITVLRSEKKNVPPTTVHLPKLPARRTPIVLYLRLPAGDAERFKAAGGTAEFVLRNGQVSMGGQVQVANLRVTTSSHLPGDLLYSDQLWVQSRGIGRSWQPETATVAISLGNNDVDGAVEAVIMAGGYK